MDFADLYQHRQLKHQAAAIRQTDDASRHRQQQSKHTIDELEARVERLTLLTESMWELLCEVSGLTPEHLHYKLHQVDARDGQVDGRRRPVPATCRCEAKIPPRSKICQFCGEDAPPRSAFDAV
ncbi:MAG: hypothetical protein ACRBI6_21190 [Acidimicrobiales bacterium]